MRVADKEALKRYYSENREAILMRRREYYVANKEKVKTRERRRYWDAKLRALAVLGGECQICRIDHPAVLQFHHRNPTDKKFEVCARILSAPSKYPWDTAILPEIMKCDLLCANCHFMYHYDDHSGVDDVSELSARSRQSVAGEAESPSLSEFGEVA